MNDTGDPPSRVLSGDHRDLDQTFEEFKVTPLSQTGRRGELFDQFSTDLRRHIGVEERLLFPVFGQGDPSRRGLVELMLDEHRRIEDVLRRIRLRLDAGPSPTEDLEIELVNVLWAHNAREEESVYPWFDTHLPAELARTVERELRHPGPMDDEPPSTQTGA
jgi:hemerythrin-like domain-containing protein